MASHAAFVAMAGMLAANLPWLVLQGQVSGLHSMWAWNGEQKCKAKNVKCGASGSDEVAAGASCTRTCTSGTPSSTAAIACPASKCAMTGTGMSGDCGNSDP